METINNVAAAASKAIWGEQQNPTQGNETAGNEPISGVQGKGNVNEPFDQGNAANPISASTHGGNTISKTSDSSPSTTTSAHTSLPDRTADKMTSNTDNTFGNTSNTGNTFGSTSNTDNPLSSHDTSSTHAHGSGSTGPHDIDIANRLDPRVGSDNSDSYGNTTGGGLTGSSGLGDNSHSHSHSHGSDPSGPHDSHLGNKVDPRVDSDRSGSYGNTTSGGLTGSHGNNNEGGLTRSSDLTGNTHSHSHTHGSDPTGPHDSRLGNKADPRVDSEQVGSVGNTTSGGLTGPHNDTTGGGPRPHENTDKTGVIGGHGDPFKTSDNAASESKASTGPPGADAGGSHKQQGADRPNEEPTGHQEGAVKKSKDDAEDFLKTKDPNDHSGEPMHMHTGTGDGSSVPKTQAERRESKIGNPGGQEHGKETSEGTGEQWVKTSGMAADGGDFDATKPGAGREADRLMEAKGIHKTEPGKPSEPIPESAGHGSHGDKEKVPLGQKIKDKLHIGGSKDK